MKQANKTSFTDIVSAGVLLIGNELLSGRTQDTNLSVIATALANHGIQLAQANIIKDDDITIIEHVQYFSKKFDYVITTGGIGPTHDDITSQSIAKAFALDWVLNAQAYNILKRLCQEKNIELNEARLRMAHIPKGATLINNPVSGAPGFKINNVFVLAGVPSIMTAMLPYALLQMRSGSKMLTENITCDLPEGAIATNLLEIEKKIEDIEIGSYPRSNNGKAVVTLVIRSFDKNKIKNAALLIANMIEELDGNILK